MSSPLNSIKKFFGKKDGYGELAPTNEERAARVEKTVQKQALLENFNSNTNNSETQHLLMQTSDVETMGDKAAQGGNLVRKVVSGASSASSMAGHVAPVLSVLPSPVAPTMQVVSAVRAGTIAVTSSSTLGKIRQVQANTKDDEVGEFCDYAAAQVNSRLSRAKKAIFMGGPMTIYSAGNALKKMYDGTRGEERLTYAEDIWEGQRSGDTDCIALCSALMGEDQFAKLKDTADGFKALKKALSSNI